METASHLLHAFAEWTSIVASFLAVMLVLVGTLRAGWGTMRWLASRRSLIGISPRSLWLDYARCLVAALTFQLGADIVETTLAPSWEDIGRLAAIAAVRTFLNYFLDRDLREIGGEGAAGTALERNAQASGKG